MRNFPPALPSDLTPMRSRTAGSRSVAGAVGQAPVTALRRNSGEVRLRLGQMVDGDKPVRNGDCIIFGKVIAMTRGSPIFPAPSLFRPLLFSVPAPVICPLFLGFPHVFKELMRALHLATAHLQGFTGAHAGVHLLDCTPSLRHGNQEHAEFAGADWGASFDETPPGNFLASPPDGLAF